MYVCVIAERTTVRSVMNGRRKPTKTAQTASGISVFTLTGETEIATNLH